MIFVIWQPYILSLGLTVVDLGIVQSVINLSTMTGLLIWGPLSDMYGRKRVMLLGHASRVLAVTALLYSGNIIFLYVFALFAGFSCLWQQMNPARTALIAESVEGERRATALATLMTISQGVSVIIASVGGYLALVAGYWPIFAVAIAGEAIGILLMAVFVKETHVVGNPDGKKIGEKIIANLRPEKELTPLYVMMAVMGVGYGVGYSLFYGALTDTYGLTTLDLGLMSTATSLAWALGSIPGGKLSERFGARLMINISTLSALIAAVGYTLFRSLPALIIFSVFNGLDPCFWMPNWLSIIAEKTSQEKRASILGKLDAYNRLAMIPAPYLGGLIYAAYGFTAPLLVHIACIFVWGYLVLVTVKPKSPT
jgi:MFS family permease